MRNPIAALALAALQGLLPGAAFAQSYPSKAVRLVVGFPAGGPADIFGRTFAQALSAGLSQPVVVENKSGVGGVLGIDMVAKALPDGYTLGFNNQGSVAMAPYALAKMPFNPNKDLALITTVVKVPEVVVVNPSLPVSSLAELIAYAKANPGKLNYASSGAATPYHMAGELFKAMSGTDMVHVPHKASGEMRNSVIGGHVQMAFDAITTMASNVKAGQVRALGTSAAKRSSVLPDVPTIAEAGVPGYESTIWLGIMAPAGTPKAIVDKLNAEIVKVVNRPDVKETWDKQGAVPLVMSPAEFDAYLRKDIEKWAQVVKAAGLKAE